MFYLKVNYFDGPAIEKPLLHTWSLAIEEQYYLLWPLALAGLYRAGYRKALPYIVLALLCLSLGASQMVLGRDQAAAFYLLPYRGWELLLGGYLAVASFPPMSRVASNLACLAGFAAIAYAASAFDIETPFPGLNALFPCLGAAMLIAAGQQEGALSRSVLGFRPIRLVGKISYSLYLIHWPLFSFAHMAFDGQPPLSVRLVIVAVSLLLAALSYRYIETPARRARLRFFVLVRAAAAGAVSLALLGGIYDASNGLPWRVPKSVEIAYAAKFPGYVENDRADCRDDPKPGLVHRPCPIGAAAQDLQYDFVIWGDSHARHFASAFSDQAKPLGLAGLVIWEARCPPLLNEDRVSAECREANAAAEQWIATQTKLKMVFLAATWKTYVKHGLLGPSQSRGTVFGNAQAEQNDSAGRLDGTMNLLRSKGLPFAIVEAVPSFGVKVPDCAARARMFGNSDEHCFSFPRRRIQEDARLASAILGNAARRFGVPIVETAQAFCGADTCRPEKDGVIFYTDDSHLNRAGSHYLGTRINIPWPSTQAALGAHTR